MKNTGIWIDKNRAVLIFLEGATEQIKEIPSNLDHFKIPTYEMAQEIQRLLRLL